MPKRDEFAPKVKIDLAHRSGHHCSNPQCRSLTTGPEAIGMGAVNMGIAAHISAASPGGARYDPDISSAERSSINNGIWLCTPCASLIDKKNGEGYPVQVLDEWKSHAENAARSGIQRPDSFVAGETNAFTRASVFRFKKPSRYFEIMSWTPPFGRSYYEPVEYKHIGGPADRGTVDYVTPIVLDSIYGEAASSCAFVLQLENAGTAVQQFASIQIKMDGPVLFKQIHLSDQRIVPMCTIAETSKSSVGGFRIQNLAPGECVSMQINSDIPGPFNASWYCSCFSHSRTPDIIEVSFGKPNHNKLPPRDSNFIEKHFPFK